VPHKPTLAHTSPHPRAQIHHVHSHPSTRLFHPFTYSGLHLHSPLSLSGLVCSTWCEPPRCKHWSWGRGLWERDLRCWQASFRLVWHRCLFPSLFAQRTCFVLWLCCTVEDVPGPLAGIPTLTCTQTALLLAYAPADTVLYSFVCGSLV
jgi:hypothetical protein